MRRGRKTPVSSMFAAHETAKINVRRVVHAYLSENLVGAENFTEVGHHRLAAALIALRRFEEALTNPFKLEEAEGAEADDMRMKLLFDLAYSAALETLPSFLRVELGVIIKTPLVMVLGLGR